MARQNINLSHTAATMHTLSTNQKKICGESRNLHILVYTVGGMVRHVDCPQGNQKNLVFPSDEDP
jgi:hypothetical protein